MKEFTKILKNEAEKDTKKLRTSNNIKDSKRTSDQKYQSKCDRFHYFWKKWDTLYYKCETKTQEKIVCQVLQECINMMEGGLENETGRF